ncbi:copper resistance protein [Amycolatopsis mediterranei S699]|uniref:Copper resistance protein n=2 Tax=Amycolatopsis mediterranei TaxID=33910 RepID=A0A0H3DDH9_AMYMU|nr:copper resistance CopC family protein [Amycolatopsis mediterranei]ADJ48267.1 copper resistance protein [Amycolatopsis mediterranei U32]AEK45178.1 copper resistance protein [Amycolatopsis mediterranei S699]AFO79978.1 copper resistance protein [Amycolatopsis mediterranei S699]AGT87106.1 copper resistance protein [Amycolatopsis mediterranei RB]KDO10422.1 copper resistance protein [Amycolatopsis mediterranei]
MKIVRLFAAALLALAGLLAFAGPASAHAALKSSSPAEGASLAAAPQKVELTFEEAVTLQPDPISVTGPDGAKWTVSPPTVTDATITAAVVPTGPAGAYTLTYKVVSDDGDKVTSAVHFTLTAPASPPATSSSAAPTSSSAPATTASPTPAASSDTSGGIPAWVWILIAVVVIVAAVVVGLRLRRSRQ